MKMKKGNENRINIPNLEFNSDWFECRKCGNKEMRLVLGDISPSPCSKCGNSPMYRVK